MLALCCPEIQGFMASLPLKIHSRGSRDQGFIACIVARDQGFIVHMFHEAVNTPESLHMFALLQGHKERGRMLLEKTQEALSAWKSFSESGTPSPSCLERAEQEPRRAHSGKA